MVLGGGRGPWPGLLRGGGGSRPRGGNGQVLGVAVPAGAAVGGVAEVQAAGTAPASRRGTSGRGMSGGRRSRLEVGPQHLSAVPRRRGLPGRPADLGVDGPNGPIAHADVYFVLQTA